MATFEKFVEPACDCRAVLARLVARESKDGRGRPAPGSIAVCDCSKCWELVKDIDGEWWRELRTDPVTKERWYSSWLRF